VKIDLLDRFTEQHLGCPIKHVRPFKLDGDQVSEALWPLNKLFRANLSAIQTLAYDALYEREADAAIAGLAFDPEHDLATLSSGAWRVFLERHYQSLMLAALQLEEPFLSVPEGLPQGARTGFLLLFQYHGMPLPFPIQDLSNAELPQPNAPGSLRRH